jgi:DNA repair photolyase
MIQFMSKSEIDAEPTPDPTLPDRARKGRGSVSNRSGRYEPGARPLEDDGWQGLGEAGGETPENEDLPSLRTVLGIDAARSIISRNTSPDIPFDQSINPYRGCEHGCIYCYARPTHAYLGHSPGLDFERLLYMKPDAAALLDKELRRPGYRPSMIALGTNTDPYQPVERRQRITRQILEVLSAFNHPVGITTKSAGVLRDLDLLSDMAGRGLVSVALSITTLDGSLARAMEPRASAPVKRLDAIARLRAANIPVFLMLAPIIPGLTDHEIEAIVEAAAKAGVEGISWILLRLPLEIKDLFTEWLEAHYPLRAKRVLDLMRETHAGQLYRAQFGLRRTGSGPVAEMIGQRVRAAIRRHGLDAKRPRKTRVPFAVPEKAEAQLRLF